MILLEPKELKMEEKRTNQLPLLACTQAPLPVRTPRAGGWRRWRGPRPSCAGWRDCSGDGRSVPRDLKLCQRLIWGRLLLLGTIKGFCIWSAKGGHCRLRAIFSTLPWTYDGAEEAALQTTEHRISEVNYVFQNKVKIWSGVPLCFMPFPPSPICILFYLFSTPV